MAMHSISDLTTYAQDTRGDIPPPLVGASTTVVGNTMYLFGGRLNTLRRMTSDIYSFNLSTCVWEKLALQSPESLTPAPRYFHSADCWNDHLIVFGGMGYASRDSETLCVLSDVRFFSLRDHRWLPVSNGSISPVDPALTSGSHNLLGPRPRYAHLSAVSSSRLYIIGGQDMTNQWLDDIHVYDLNKRIWLEKRDYPRHCGTYRSVAVSGLLTVRDPAKEGRSTKRSESPFASLKRATGPADSMLHPHPLQAQSDQLVYMPYSSDPTTKHPAEIHLYSNYNFTDVQRELEVITPTEESFNISDRSATMVGPGLPPGLRFPTGAILGNHLIIAGTYLAQSYQSFSLWALDLSSMTWSRIDPGTSLNTGSWSRGVLWPDTNRYAIFGNRHGNLVEDYNRRLLNWDHVAYIELEAFGIYKLPPLRMPLAGQQLGLDALESEAFADFDILCEDGRKIRCSRKLLEERWPWFRRQRIKYIEAANKIINTQTRSEYELPMPPPLSSQIFESDEDRPDPRLTPRLLRLSEPYPITKALLQYFYTWGLVTPLQHAPLVLSSLLLLSAIYQLPYLEALVKHAMHRTLSPATSVGVYEVATLCDCQNLQIRALRVVMSSSKRNTTRNRHERDRQDRPPTRSDDNNEHAMYNRQARARGMSDAPTRQGFDLHSHQQHQHHNHHHVANNASSGGGMDGHGSVARRVILSLDADPDAHDEQALLRPPPQGHSGAADGLGGHTTRNRSDSGIRGRTVSNATDPKEAGLHSHSSSHTRDGSVTPTAPQLPSSSVDVNPTQASEALRESSQESKASEMTPSLRASHSSDAGVQQEQHLKPMRQPSLRRSSLSQGSSPLSSPVVDPSKLAKMGFGRRSRQDLLALTSDTSSTVISPVTPLDTPGPTPPAKDMQFLSPSNITPPSHITSVPFYSLPSTTTTTVSSNSEKRYLSRQQSDMALRAFSQTNTDPNGVANGDQPKTPREYRRRSVSDAGPSSRPLTSRSNSTTSGESSTASIETPVDENNGAAPRSPLTPTSADQHEYYDLSQDIYISPPRSDHRGKHSDRRNDNSALVSNSSAGAADAAAAEKGKKTPWRNRLLAVATSNVLTSSSADNHNGSGGRSATSTKSRMHLWSSSSPSSKPMPPVDSPVEKKLAKAHLLYSDSRP